MLCRIMTVFLLVAVIQTNADINQEVSAIIDKQNQEEYQNQIDNLKQNQEKSDTYSNCPTCPKQ